MKEVYVSSLGKTAKTVLDGIATFVNSSSMTEVMSVVGTVSIIMLVVLFACNMVDIKGLLKWVAAYVLIPICLIMPKDTVLIHDMTRPLDMHTVDNVPEGLALPLYLSSSLIVGTSYALTNIFHTPGDNTYETTGMIWGATLFEKLNQAYPDPEIQSLFSQYMYQCVDTAIRVRGEYTYQDLRDSPDIMEFLSSKAKNGYHKVKMPDGSMVGCQTAITEIQKLLSNSVSDQYAKIRREMNLPAFDTDADIGNLVASTYQNYFDMSATQQSTMIQSMAINAFRESIGDISNSKNATTAAIQAAYVENEATTTASNWTIGIAAQKSIVMMQTILVLLLCLGFIPAVVVAMFPNMTYLVVKNYIRSMLYVYSWIIFYILINFIMTSIMEDHIRDYGDVYKGLTLSNVDEVQQITFQYASMTGYLLMLVPYLSLIIVRGLSNVMPMLATSLMAQTAHNTQSGSELIAKGNMSMGNMSFGSYSANNTSMNKHDINETYMAGMTTMQTEHGGTVSTTANGSQIYNTSDAISKQPFNIHAADQISENLSQNATKHEQISLQQGERAASTIQSSLDEGLAFDSNHSQGNGLTYNGTDAHTQQQTQAYNDLKSMSEKYGSDVVSQFAADASFGANIPMTNIGGSVKGSFSDSDSHHISADDQETIQKSISALTSETGSLSSSDFDQQSYNLLNNMRAALGSAESYAKESQLQHNLSVDEAKTAQYMQSHSVSLDQNATREFEKWFKNEDLSHVNDSTANLYLSDPDRQHDEFFQGKVREFVSQEYGNKILDRYEHDMGETIGNAKQVINDAVIGSNSEIEQSFEHNKDVVNNAEHDSQALREMQKSNQNADKTVSSLAPDISSDGTLNWDGHRVDQIPSGSISMPERMYQMSKDSHNYSANTHALEMHENHIKQSADEFVEERSALVGGGKAPLGGMDLDIYSGRGGAALISNYFESNK